MKLLLSLLILSAGLGLSAQDFRLRADLGSSGQLFNNSHPGPAANLGLEFIAPISARFFFTQEIGMQYTDFTYSTDRMNVFDGFPEGIIVGQVTVDFNSIETYRIQRTEAYFGFGLEQHLNRLRLQVSSRVAYRLADQLEFSERTLFLTMNRPDDVMTISTKAGEEFSQDSQTGRMDFDHRIQYQAGASVRYDLNGRLEVGVSAMHYLGNYRLQRRVISFCEGCPVNNDNRPERVVKSGMFQLQFSARYVL